MNATVLKNEYLTIQRGLKTSDVHLSWEYKTPVKYFRVFRNEVFLGTTKLERYLDRTVQIESKVTYRVDALSFTNEVVANGDITLS